MKSAGTNNNPWDIAYATTSNDVEMISKNRIVS